MSGADRLARFLAAMALVAWFAHAVMTNERLDALEAHHAEPEPPIYEELAPPSDMDPAFMSGREPWTETERHIRVGDPADLIGRRRCSIGLESLEGGK